MPSKKKKTVKFSELADQGIQALVDAAAAGNAPVDSDNAPEPALSSAPTPASFFPLAKYTSVVGVHTTLLAFTGLFLPRTSSLPAIHAALASLGVLDSSTQTQTRSADRPEHAFLTALTAQPVLTLIWLCAGAAVVQGWWAGWLRDWAGDFYGRLETDEQKIARKTDAWSQKLLAQRNAWFATLVASLILHIVIVLFGAPITSHPLHTYLLALLLSLLIVLPATYTLGSPLSSSGGNALIKRMTFTRIFAELSARDQIERSLLHPSLGAAFGAWVGVIPLALDWDRPWQAYPLPPAYGAVAGYVIGTLVALTTNSIGFLAEQDRERIARLKRD